MKSNRRKRHRSTPRRTPRGRTRALRTSKSPLAVAAEAYAAGRQALRDYSHRFSPRKFTQPQLFAALVLKSFFKTDYRGIRQILNDSSDLQRVLELNSVPHWTTLQKAARRLLAQGIARTLLGATVRRYYGRRRNLDLVALDSSGFDAHHASRYYVNRRKKGQDKEDPPAQETTYKHYAKFEAAVACDSHLILGVLAGRGPRPDADRLPPLLDEALKTMRVATALADAGYDSEPAHRHARQVRGVRSVMPALTGRPSPNPPTGRWRRMMKRRLRTKASRRRWRYGQRWQAETAISMVKRRQSVAVAGRTDQSRCRDLRLLALTHNVLILYAPWGFLHSISELLLGTPKAQVSRPVGTRAS